MVAWLQKKMTESCYYVKYSQPVVSWRIRPSMHLEVRLGVILTPKASSRGEDYPNLVRTSLTISLVDVVSQ